MKYYGFLLSLTSMQNFQTLEWRYTDQSNIYEIGINYDGVGQAAKLNVWEIILIDWIGFRLSG